jgi:hypothetical protein
MDNSSRPPVIGCVGQLYTRLVWDIAVAKISREWTTSLLIYSPFITTHLELEQTHFPESPCHKSFIHE